MSKILIILINYNGIIDTLACIKSIKESTCKSDIFVVDNSITESDFLQLSKIEDIVVVRCDNKGFSAANNIGLKYAIDNQYEYAILLNNDTIVDQKMVELLVDNCDEKTVSLPYMYYYYYKDKLWYGGGSINRYLGLANHYNYEEHKEESTYITGCCVCIPMTILREVGYFNEKFFMYCEDFDYSIRLLKHKKRIRVVSDAKLWHKVGASSKESFTTTYYNVRNRLLLIHDNKYYFSFWAMPYVLVTRFLKMVYYRIKRDSIWKAYYKAMYDFFQGLSGKIE